MTQANHIVEDVGRSYDGFPRQILQSLRWNYVNVESLPGRVSFVDSHRFFRQGWSDILVVDIVEYVEYPTINGFT